MSAIYPLPAPLPRATVPCLVQLPLVILFKVTMTTIIKQRLPRLLGKHFSIRPAPPSFSPPSPPPPDAAPSPAPCAPSPFSSSQTRQGCRERTILKAVTTNYPKPDGLFGLCPPVVWSPTPPPPPPTPAPTPASAPALLAEHHGAAPPHLLTSLTPVPT